MAEKISEWLGCHLFHGEVKHWLPKLRLHQFKVHKSTNDIHLRTTLGWMRLRCLLSFKQCEHVKMSQVLFLSNPWEKRFLLLKLERGGKKFSAKTRLSLLRCYPPREDFPSRLASIYRDWQGKTQFPNSKIKVSLLWLEVVKTLDWDRKLSLLEHDRWWICVVCTDCHTYD